MIHSLVCSKFDWILRIFKNESIRHDAWPDAHPIHNKSNCTSNFKTQFMKVSCHFLLSSFVDEEQRSHLSKYRKSASIFVDYHEYLNENVKDICSILCSFISYSLVFFTAWRQYF